MFRLSVETIARWEMEAMSPGGEGPRPLVAPAPPVRRFVDVVSVLVKAMELGFGGNDLIARTLARSGWRLSSRTVGRIRKERWPLPRVPEAAPTVSRAVRAKRPNHVMGPLVAEDLMAKIEIGLLHYAHFRPHQGLGGATPAEVYFGNVPSHLSAIPPPRGKPGEGPMHSPFRIEYLDAEQLLPILVKNAA